MKVRVSTTTCRLCGKITDQTIRPAHVGNEDPLDDEISGGPTPVSPAFTGYHICPDHLPALPGDGYIYTAEACPLYWTVNILDLSTDS